MDELQDVDTYKVSCVMVLLPDLNSAELVLVHNSIMHTLQSRGSGQGCNKMLFLHNLEEGTDQ